MTLRSFMIIFRYDNGVAVTFFYKGPYKRCKFEILKSEIIQY